MIRTWFASALLCLANTHTTSATSKVQFTTDVQNATDVLNQDWYNETTGLWQNMWWNSGAMLSTIGDVAMLSPSFRPSYERIIENTLVAAKAANGGSFLNTFYDDEGWWAMGWIKAFDVTQNSTYLDTAKEIFEDLVKGDGATCGGHWWNKDKTVNSAIANELYLDVAASLANRVSSKEQQYYRDIAYNQANWILNKSGLMNENNTIVDGLDIHDCTPSGPVFSYNQGVILGALVEMHKIFPNSNSLDIAVSIAKGAIAQLATPYNGILTDAGYPGNEDGTGQQFKGIFARNLMYLNRVKPEQEFADFWQQNADSVWSNDRQKGTGHIGVHWQGPIVDVSAASQSSAIDCLLGAAGVSS